MVLFPSISMCLLFTVKFHRWKIHRKKKHSPQHVCWSKDWSKTCKFSIDMSLFPLPSLSSISPFILSLSSSSFHHSLVKHETWFILFVMKWCDYFHLNNSRKREEGKTIPYSLFIHLELETFIRFSLLPFFHLIFIAHFDLQIELQLEVKRKNNPPSEGGHSSMSSIGKTHNFECWCNAYGGHQTVSSRRASLQFSSKFNSSTISFLFFSLYFHSLSLLLFPCSFSTPCIHNCCYISHENGKENIFVCIILQHSLLIDFSVLLAQSQSSGKRKPLLSLPFPLSLSLPFPCPLTLRSLNFTICPLSGSL